MTARDRAFVYHLALLTGVSWLSGLLIGLGWR
jgi:hypothetical protein